MTRHTSGRSSNTSVCEYSDRRLAAARAIDEESEGVGDHDDGADFGGVSGAAGDIHDGVDGDHQRNYAREQPGGGSQLEPPRQGCAHRRAPQQRQREQADVGQRVMRDGGASPTFASIVRELGF